MRRCYRCSNPATFLVTGAGKRFEVCDPCLEIARKAAGNPRTTTLLDPLARPAAKAAGDDAVQPSLF